MTLTLSDELFRSTRMTEKELQIELAIALFQKETFTLGQAARSARLPQIEFQRLLASRMIPIHYGLEELEQDLKRVRGLKSV